MARSSKSEPTESGATAEPRRQARRVTSRSGATRLGAKTRVAPPARGTDARGTRARAKPVPEAAREVARAKADPPAAAEPRLPEVMRMPDVEPLSPAPLMAAAAGVLAGDRAPGPTPELAPIVEPAKAVPPEAVELEAAMVATTVVDAQTVSVAIPDVMREVDRLRDMALLYWRDHLERTMAAGQAIVACGSPQAAVRLQMTYLQSSLASGIAHAGGLARLSTEIARDMMPFRGR